MSKNEMISISAMDKIIKDTVEESVEVDFHGQQLVIKKFLPFSEMIGFVNEVVEGCFSEDGEYLPEIKSFLAEINLISYYSNVRLPDDTKHKYDIINKTSIVPVIQQAIDQDQYRTIMRSIDEKINHRVYTNEQLFNNRLEQAITTINTIVNSVKESFDGITPEDLKNIVGAISENGVDEEKIVKAYLNQSKGTESQYSTDANA